MPNPPPPVSYSVSSSSATPSGSKATSTGDTTERNNLWTGYKSVESPAARLQLAIFGSANSIDHPQPEDITAVLSLITTDGACPTTAVQKQQRDALQDALASLKSATITAAAMQQDKQWFISLAQKAGFEEELDQSIVLVDMPGQDDAAADLSESWENIRRENSEDGQTLLDGSLTPKPSNDGLEPLKKRLAVESNTKGDLCYTVADHMLRLAYQFGHSCSTQPSEPMPDFGKPPLGKFRKSSSGKQASG